MRENIVGVFNELYGMAQSCHLKGTFQRWLSRNIKLRVSSLGEEMTFLSLLNLLSVTLVAWSPGRCSALSVGATVYDHIDRRWHRLMLSKLFNQLPCVLIKGGIDHAGILRVLLIICLMVYTTVNRSLFSWTLSVVNQSIYYLSSLLMDAHAIATYRLWADWFFFRLVTCAHAKDHSVASIFWSKGCVCIRHWLPDSWAVFHKGERFVLNNFFGDGHRNAAFLVAAEGNRCSQLWQTSLWRQLCGGSSWLVVATRWPVHCGRAGNHWVQVGEGAFQGSERWIKDRRLISNTICQLELLELMFNLLFKLFEYSGLNLFFFLLFANSGTLPNTALTRWMQRTMRSMRAVHLWNALDAITVFEAYKRLILAAEQSRNCV